MIWRMLVETHPVMCLCDCVYASVCEGSFWRLREAIKGVGERLYVEDAEHIWRGAIAGEGER